MISLLEAFTFLAHFIPFRVDYLIWFVDSHESAFTLGRGSKDVSPLGKRSFYLIKPHGILSMDIVMSSSYPQVGRGVRSLDFFSSDFNAH